MYSILVPVQCALHRVKFIHDLVHDLIHDLVHDLIHDLIHDLVRLYKERQETKECPDAVKEGVKMTQQQDQKGDVRTTQQKDQKKMQR